MADQSSSDGILNKIIVGVAVAIIPTLIIYYLGIGKKDGNNNNPGADTKEQVVKQSNVEEAIDYKKFIGVYTGETINTEVNAKGSTRLNLKDIDNYSKKVKVDVEWSNGLFGYAKLNGTVTGTKIELQGLLSSDETGQWEIDMVIELIKNSNNIEGTYHVYPQSGNANGTQNGIFKLSKTG